VKPSRSVFRQPFAIIADMKKLRDEEKSSGTPFSADRPSWRGILIDYRTFFDEASEESIKTLQQASEVFGTAC